MNGTIRHYLFVEGKLKKKCLISQTVVSGKSTQRFILPIIEYELELHCRSPTSYPDQVIFYRRPLAAGVEWARLSSDPRPRVAQLSVCMSVACGMRP